MKQLTVPISPGELIDKITILEIKRTRIGDPAKLEHIQYELDLLENVWRASSQETPKVTKLRDQLRAVNEQLWQIEDDIRVKEAHEEFDESFIELARSVYRNNDWRADLKRQINLNLGSDLVEEKSYQAY